MTAPLTAQSGRGAGAPAHDAGDWHAIDWPTAHGIVRRLQARIVKATQAGRWNKVKALQRLLTHSHSGKVLAVRRVTENPGKRTPGLDGETWGTPEKKARAIHALRWRGYHPQPLKRVYIPKANGTRRPLGIAAMRDRAMQALYLLALDPVAETLADPNSYGFRKDRCTADAIQHCHTVLSNRGGAKWILEGDITRCFERLSHQWLLAHIPMDRAILRKWLTAGYMEEAVLHPTEEGAVQGGPISPVLANLALDGLEHKLRERYPKATTRSRKAKVNLVRFADDFVITGSSKELLEHDIKPLVENFLKERGLELSAEKTGITRIEDGFDFLGQHIRDYHGSILVKPSRKNVAAFLGKVRGIIKAHKQATAGNLIGQLNPVIRNWATYHRHAASKYTFTKVDNALFLALWRWACRRHPTKPRRWIKDKYFLAIGERKWVFSGKRPGPKGHAQWIQLVSAASLPIVRHVKIRAAANPYGPVWEGYFDARLGLKMATTLRGKRALLYLWQEQQGLCPVCTQPITDLTGWDNHHVVWRSHGGSDGAANRVLLHPACHRQVHSQGLTVVKPRPAKGRKRGSSCLQGNLHEQFLGG
jgi:RNA-directed DNA polymerase